VAIGAVNGLASRANALVCVRSEALDSQRRIWVAAPRSTACRYQ
jgi:hypothetical protein